MRFRPLLRSFLGIAFVSSALAACGGAPRGNGMVGSTPASGISRVERRDLEHHPPINLLVRSGDPLPAIAFASVNDQGSVASVALAALVMSRLQAHGLLDVVSVPSENGFELATLCADAGSAREFINQITAALATPLSEGDSAAAHVADALSALRQRTLAGHAEMNAAACSGDLGLLPGTLLPDPRNPAGRAALERFRKAAFSTRASAFAALGPQAFVDDAVSALSRANSWPSGDDVEDPWPARDSVGVDTAEGTRHLTVALRVADAERALDALAPLGASDGDFTQRLRTFSPAFDLDRLAFNARPRGACLRADLTVKAALQAPTPSESAIAANLVTDELRAAYAGSTPDHALEQSVVTPGDPRDAVARAARRALTGRLEPGAERRVVALSVHASERAAFNEFASKLAILDAGPPKAPVESRIRVEPGQGELWLLAGSPCGTLGESDDDAGQSALFMTLAARAHNHDVTLEPWLTSDAVGVLAHAARRPGETPKQLAARVSRALARALTERDTRGSSFTDAQNSLFLSIGTEPRPGYERLLEALSPDHLAWLEPRGSWTTVSSASGDAVTARGRELLHGPLRIAVLANEDDAQGEVAKESFERWLAPFRDEPRTCQSTSVRGGVSGELSLSVNDDAPNENAYVGVPFASRLRFGQEAEAIAALLNRDNGRLAQALATAHLNASTRVQVVGGAHAAALVIEIRATDDDTHRAVLEVRRVLDRLITTPLSSTELEFIERTTERQALTARLDPRRRIVDLWRGATPALTAESVRAFQTALNPAAEVVVYVTRRN